MQKENVRI